MTNMNKNWWDEGPEDEWDDGWEDLDEWEDDETPSTIADGTGTSTPDLPSDPHAGEQ